MRVLGSDPNPVLASCPVNSTSPIGMYFGTAAGTIDPTKLRMPQTVPSGLFGSDLAVEETAKGTHIVKDMRVFRTGTFTDMFGNESTWTDAHLAQMALHFAYLREADIFPNVPVRIDHLTSMAEVIGWFSSVHLDPTDPDFLSADIEFTEPDAFEQWQRGTLRNRSLEVGMYRTNDGASYFPCVIGLAFVDIPAIEGLYAAPKSENSMFSQLIADKEATAVDINDPRWPDAVRYAQWAQAAQYAQAAQDWEAAATYAQWEQAASYAQACADWETAANYAALLQAQGGNPTDPTPPAPFGAPPAPPAPQAYSFRVGGATITDPVMVQAHIDGLEAYQQTTLNAFRTSYVEQLALDGKIGRPQVETLTAHALSLTPEQFDAFKASYDAAAVSSLFQSQGNPNPDGPTPSSAPSLAQQELLEEQVKQLYRSGMTPEQVEKSSIFKNLQAIKAGK